MNLKFRFILLLVCGKFIFNDSLAQPKSLIIERNVLVVDGIANNIQPGDTLFLESGPRKEILFKNLTGSATQSILILNKTGKVIITSDKDYGIFLSNSIYCRVSGSGGADKYGIEIAATNNHGLVVAEFSTDCEADHLEIHHSSFAGVVAKTDPNCKRKDLRFFTMKNLSFHDNYIHDTFAEGFYVGYSWYPAREYQCDKDSLLYPHQIHSVRIYNNVLENTGQEGIQVGGATRDVKIYSNYVRNYGTHNERWQNHGVQIGQGTTGEFFNNVIDRGPAEGLSLFGGGNNKVYCNTISNTGSSAIYQNDRNAIDNSTYQIFENSFINNAGNAVVMVSNKTKGNIIHDNVFITTQPDSAFVDESKMKWKNENNRISHDTNDIAALKKKCSQTKFDFIPFENENLNEVVLLKTTGHLLVRHRGKHFELRNDAGLVLTNVPLRTRRNKITADLSSQPNGIYYLLVERDLYRIEKHAPKQ